jgi:hypothetical protein
VNFDSQVECGNSYQLESTSRDGLGFRRIGHVPIEVVQGDGYYLSIEAKMINYLETPFTNLAAPAFVDLIIWLGFT